MNKQQTIRAILVAAAILFSVAGKAQNDTVRVIMLVCDTTYHPKSEGWVVNSRGVYWQFGYEVLKFIPAGWDDRDNQFPNHYIHSAWLNENKKPLSKSIIVWQSIQTK